jgi:hypothetical protein
VGKRNQCKSAISAEAQSAQKRKYAEAKILQKRLRLEQHQRINASVIKD